MTTIDSWGFYVLRPVDFPVPPMEWKSKVMRRMNKRELRNPGPTEVLREHQDRMDRGDGLSSKPRWDTEVFWASTW